MRGISAKMRLFLQFWLIFLEIPQRKTIFAEKNDSYEYGKHHRQKAGTGNN